MVIFSEVTKNEYVKQRHTHSTAENRIAHHCAAIIRNSWVLDYCCQYRTRRPPSLTHC